MSRIHGLDLARSLAIIGMMAAHIGPEHPVTNGYPSVLFAVLAGVSLGIISRNTTDDPVTTRFRLVLRGVILIALGLVLGALQFGILEVLSAIGVSYLLLTPVAAWTTRRLAILLATLVILGPLLGAVNHVLLIGWADHLMEDLLFGAYPLLAWLAYLLVGLLIHRLALGSARREAWLTGIGLVLLVGVQLFLELTGFRVGPHDLLNEIGAFLQGEPHTGGLLDVLGSAGAAMALTGTCLLACRVAAVVWVSYPLRALGAMSLSIYITHVIITTLANGTFLTVSSVYGASQQYFLPKEEYGPGVQESFDYLDGIMAENTVYIDPNWWWFFATQVVGLLLFASLWRWRFRRGPVEWGMHRLITGATTRP